MPSTSAKQAKFMRAVAHSPKFAKKVGVPQSVGKDFEMADKKKMKFGSGGMNKKPMMESDRKPIDMRRAILGSDKDIVARGNRTPYEPIPKKGPTVPNKPVKKDPDTLGVKKLAKGGSAMKKASKAGNALVKKSADTMGRAMKMNKGGKCYAKGGTASARADGIAKKGKTRGKVLAKGGMC